MPDNEDTPIAAPYQEPLPKYRSSSGKGQKEGKGSKSNKSSKEDSKSNKSDRNGNKVGGGGGGKPSPKPTPAHKPVPAPTPSSPTPHSSGSGSSDDIPDRPPAEIPPSSVIMPALNPTPSPASVGPTIPVTLNVYAIDYLFSQSAPMPVRDDFLALEGVTADYFEQYIRNAYKDSSQSTLLEFQTFLVTSILTPGDPVQVQWESTAVFTSDSIVVPTPQFLKGVLEESLDDPQDYINSLSELTSTNPFSTTTDVMFGTPLDPASSSTTTTNRNSNANVGGIIGAVAGLSVVLATFALYRNRKLGDENSGISRKYGKGDNTVAGDTFMGDTLASSGEEDGISTESSAKSSMFWKSHNNGNSTTPTKTAIEDFDAFVSCEDDLVSMTDVLSEALASIDTNEADRLSQADAQPLNSTFRRLKEDLDSMRSKLDDGANIGELRPARRPKSVAEIERLLTEGNGKKI
ncbi:hypothetical protein IV203_015154 [Nitzschia inconspicua]|uniref:Uncharacterized protein n=1 Tax=Nitzschia inconspicua TaxID=303405 RepID=A0A9K3LA85_9STRA|nr:hypothetical protein IV203_015154 [Nitzschia inconspicua]